DATAEAARVELADAHAAQVQAEAVLDAATAEAAAEAPADPPAVDDAPTTRVDPPTTDVFQMLGAHGPDVSSLPDDGLAADEPDEPAEPEPVRDARAALD